MAPRIAIVEKKRKASSTMKDKADGATKKARFEKKPAKQPVKKPAPKQPSEDSDSFESFSDSEDGGAQLDENTSKSAPSINGAVSVGKGAAAAL